jgi:hypothetical protein
LEYECTTTGSHFFVAVVENQSIRLLINVRRVKIVMVTMIADDFVKKPFLFELLVGATAGDSYENALVFLL